MLPNQDPLKFENKPIAQWVCKLKISLPQPPSTRWILILFCTHN